MKFVDVASRSEMPPAPPGYRYLDFLGGQKGLRCFLVPHDMPRYRFMEEYPEQLDSTLTPIYNNNGICVRQDASYALPGFYVASLTDHYPALDVMDETTHLRVSLVIHELRKGMRQKLGVEYIHLHYEEKPDPSCNVHYWVMPVADPETGATTVIMRLNIRDYLARFRFPEQKETICRYNETMFDYFKKVQLARRDDALVRALKQMDTALPQPAFPGRRLEA